jgi:Fe-Mn family superoxide dismutase
MEIHHGKHHAGYTNNLNNALKGTSMEGLSIEEVLSNLNMTNMAVRNNGGAFF